MEVKPLTAKDLSTGLESKDNGLKERLEGKRTMHLEMCYGKTPDVAFTGFWNATFIKGAMNAISKAYRLHRAKPRGNTNLNKGGK